jgi:5-formyltetrahydrofolate cyclo-ligase
MMEHPNLYDEVMVTDIHTAKRTMRQAALTRRKTVNATERDAARIALAQRAVTIIEHNLALNSGETVAAYVSMGTEVPTDALLDMLVTKGLITLVPRLGRGRDIGWGEYRTHDDLLDMPRTKHGRLRPAEPEGPTLAADAIAAARVVFVPAFVIDAGGYRLGRGEGWYDRALTLRSPEALTVGICWDWELIADGESGCDPQHNNLCRRTEPSMNAPAFRVPHEAHDVPVGMALTPSRTLICRR